MSDSVTAATKERSLVIDGKITEGISPEIAENAIWEELKDLVQNEISQRELDKVINKSISSLVFSEYSVTNKAMNLSYFESLGDVELINKEFEIFEKVTASQLKRVAGKIFNLNNSNVIYYLPQPTVSV